MSETITIPVRLNAGTIKMLASELNNTESSEMSFFIEDILKKTDEYTSKIQKTVQNIIKENPFSQNRVNL